MVGKFWQDISPPYRKLIPDLQSKLYRAAAFVGKKLEKEGYYGPAAIDAFVYMDQVSRKAYLRPIVEVNSRYTMGRAALALSKRMRSGKTGLLTIITQKQVQKWGYPHLKSYCSSLYLNNKKGWRILSNPAPLIDKGVLVLACPEHVQHYLGVFSVGEDLKICQSQLVGSLKPALSFSERLLKGSLTDSDNLLNIRIKTCYERKF